ncbi:Kelch repeat-containing protein [Polyangium mundeleinium]|uniref:Kelch repeat-containing protein n=1 Tax=Polyangium mundeleinium TaxID=2995306 RepID=A0ABT5F4Y4_9BACT|nr:kelch repeat-containing protein [Polyangium mundeleinium]MDC0748689.1 kelch repeat-containing protein [Polyangium mundeleinium]
MRGANRYMLGSCLFLGVWSWAIGGCTDQGAPLPGVDVARGGALHAQAPGTTTRMDFAWTQAAWMATDRGVPRATLLTDGRVLVTGGSGFEDGVETVLASAELYDPQTNTFSAAASMIRPRNWHTATRLPDGRVLVVGGFSFNSSDEEGFYPPEPSAEIYDPATDTWVYATHPDAVHKAHSAALLSNGQVLIVGGSGQTAAELYDPQTNTWSSAGGTSAEYSCGSATELPDGKVFVRGVDAAELYDPASNSWSWIGAPITDCTDATSALLSTGKVLFTNGSSAEVYDPATNQWSLAAPLLTGRYGHTGVALDGGAFMVAGGAIEDVSMASTEIYDSATDTWSAGPPMAEKRYLHASTRLADGRVLVLGGYEHPGNRLNSAEVFDASGEAGAGGAGGMGAGGAGGGGAGGAGGGGGAGGAGGGAGGMAATSTGAGASSGGGTEVGKGCSFRRPEAVPSAGLWLCLPLLAAARRRKR